MQSWTELDLEGKANVAWAVAGIAVSVLLGYSVIKAMRMQGRLEKRLHLDGDDE
jgi:hypothetical protein